MDSDLTTNSGIFASKARSTLLAISVALTFISWGLLLSLQPAFYPSEAESKGSTPAQYGLVFGIVSLGGFLSSPIFAHFGGKIGTKILCNVSGFVQGMTAVAFGSLEYVNETWTFIGFSYLLRFIDGVANAAGAAAIVSILMALLPGYESSIPGWTQMCFGLGYTIGPVLGSLLFEFGGFSLPFYIIGGIILFLAFDLLLIVPNIKPGTAARDHKSLAHDSKPPLTIKSVFKSFNLSLPFFDKFVLFYGNGIFESMLQPHMINTEAQASQLEVSMAFLIVAGCYMVTTPITGYVCDKMKCPILLSIVGNFLLFTAFIFIGPSPFLVGLAPSVPLILGMMPFLGLGYGLVSVSTFSRAYKECIRQGYRDDVDTYFVLTSLWTASFHLGNFLGPTIAGIIVNAIGFPYTSQISMFMFLLMTILDCILYFFDKRGSKTQNKYENLS
ncbi:MFS-type transporter SLC18B1-like [Tigriopus californicus]|uniref:MFS-type transporter SLC18B1-like n=1 Tax=Tigriopus californicus TaxID=6832 RepID=UPI0027DA9CB4|nr:MFS-type transporter SLC18B1-like [Tigriopus californicus]